MTPATWKALSELLDQGAGASRARAPRVAGRGAALASRPRPDAAQADERALPALRAATRSIRRPRRCRRGWLPPTDPRHTSGLPEAIQGETGQLRWGWPLRVN